MMLTGHRGIILRLLEEAARDGRPCPTNNEMANRLGDVQDNCVSDAVRSLAMAGHIRIQAHGSRRVIEAGNGTWRTLPTQPAHVKRSGEKTRTCLRCRKLFAPEHRLRFCCDPCAERNAKVAL